MSTRWVCPPDGWTVARCSFFGNCGSGTRIRFSSLEIAVQTGSTDSPASMFSQDPLKLLYIWYYLYIDIDSWEKCPQTPLTAPLNIGNKENSPLFLGVFQKTPISFGKSFGNFEKIPYFEKNAFKHQYFKGS